MKTIIASVSDIYKEKNKSEQLQKIANIWDKAFSPTTILVCGEFSQGKSLFINAFLGRNLCAVDSDICTSVVSIIKYGEVEKVIRHYGDFSNIKSQEISFNNLDKYTSGTAKDIDNTIFVEIELPLPVLKYGLVFIDTPGVGGLDPRHAALTNHFLPKADIVLFVSDVNEPLTTTELSFIKHKILPYSNHFAVIITKSDLKDTSSVEEFRLDSINKISTNSQIDKSQINAISISAAAELYPDDDLGDSNFTRLRSFINEMAAKYRSELKLIAKDNFIELLDFEIAPLKTQLKEIEQPDINQIDIINKKKEDIDKKLAELKNENSQFRKDINNLIAKKREEVTYLFNGKASKLNQIFNNLLKDPNAHSTNGGEWLCAKLNDAIAEISSDLNMEQNRAFSEIAAMPQFDGMLNFNIDSYQGYISTRPVDTSVPINKRLTPLMSGVGIITLGCFYVATGPVGILASLGLGSYVAYKNQRDASNAYIEANLRQEYQPEVSAIIQNLNTHIVNRFMDFNKEWISVLQQRAEAYQSSLQESIDNIHKIRQSINQAVTLRMQINNKLRPLVTAREQIERICNE